MRAIWLGLALASLLLADGFKAGFGRITITPAEPIRMSGYASRNKPSEGVVHDLWAKAVAIQDDKGGRFVIVTFDVATIPLPMAEEVAARVKQRFGLLREQLALNCSHTHSGPVLRPNAYALPEAEGDDAKVVAAYSARLTDSLVEVVGKALADLKPARLGFARGTAAFAANRREPTPKGVIIGVNPKGPVDHEVPIIEVRGTDSKLRGVLFGYACHPTTLGGKSYLLNGDYAGFAQIELERAHPGATAMFMALAGADQNPNPRGTMELAERHGKELATAVEKAIAAKARPLRPPVRSALEITELKFAPHTREMFEQRLNDSGAFRVRHAQRMLRAYDAGKPVTSVAFPVQAVRFGKDLTVLLLGGETLVDYSLRAKREFRGEPVVVAGYSNDVMCYIPSLRVLKEGGYEPDFSLIYDGFPGPFDESVEERVFTAIRKAAARVGRK